MGYSHYWTQESGFSEHQLETLKEKACQLALKAAKDDIDVELVFGKNYLSVNGVDDDAHENIVFLSEPAGWQFVKTAEKPYDVVVTALLAYAHHLYPAVITMVASDGYPKEWSAGLALASKVAGYDMPLPRGVAR